jgi:hypothetical protein
VGRDRVPDRDNVIVDQDFLDQEADDWLLTAYQEDLLPLDELRRQMTELRAREQSVRAERQAILDHTADQISFLRLASC